MPNLLLILEADDAHLVQDERVLGRDLERLREEPLGQLGVVGQPVLDADVQQGKVAPGGRQVGWLIQEPFGLNRSAKWRKADNGNRKGGWYEPKIFNTNLILTGLV